MFATTELNKELGSLFKTQVVHTIEYHDLERFLSKVIGNEVKILESPNDTIHKVTLTNKPDIHDVTEIDAILRGGGFECWRMHQVFGWLMHYNYIDKGNYIVDVCW